MKQKDWTQQLKKQLTDHEEPVDDLLWTQIELQLPAPRPTRTRWLIRVAAIAASVLLLVGIYHIVSEGKKPSVSEGMASRSVSEGMVTHSVEEGITAKAVPTGTPLPCRGGVGVTNPPSARKQEEILTPPPTPPLQERGVPADTDVQEEITEMAGRKQNQVNNKTLREKEERIKEQREKETLREKKKHQEKRNPTVTVGLLASNSFSSPDAARPVLMSETSLNRYDVLLSRSDAPVYLYDYSEEEEHHAPLSLGLTVAYSFSPRLTLTSGIVYTTTSSVFTKRMRTVTMKRQQRLYYIGIPLGLQCTIIKWRSLRIYVGTGVQSDFCVKASTELEGIEQHMEKDNTRFSGWLNGGVEYRLWKVGGVYAEPTLHYYFDNGSSITNAMSERPLEWGLQIGWRFNLGD